MEFKFTFLPEFYSTLKNLPKDQQKQIVKKLADVKNIKDLSIFRHVKPLAVVIELATHRLRVGSYRIFFRVTGNYFEIHSIVHRKDAYK